MRIKKIRPRENRDKLVLGDGIVTGIVVLAVSEIPYAFVYRGVTGKKAEEKAVKVTVDKNNVSVDVTVMIHYTQSVSDMAFKIQEAVKHNVEAMTDFNVVSVNVNVSGVSFKDVNYGSVNGDAQNEVAEDKNGQDKPAVSAEIK